MSGKLVFVLNIVCGLCLFSFRAALAGSHDSLEYTRALSLYAVGNTTESYPFFEKVYFDSKTSKQQRLNAALILAYAPSSSLKLGKRHDYSIECLDNDSTLTDVVRTNLVRISGDSLFESQMLDRAATFYQRLASDSELRNRAYGEYRLGWIDLNLQKPQLALQRWSKFIREQSRALREQDEDLLKSIVRDLGKSWTESVEADLTAPEKLRLFEELPSHLELEPVKASWVEGIVLGLKRYSSEEKLREMKGFLGRTPYASQVFEALLEKAAVFRSFPCQISEWSQFGASSQLAQYQKSIFAYTSECAKFIVDKQLCEKPAYGAFQNYFESFALDETQLPSRISLSVACKKWVSSCRDFTDLAYRLAQRDGTRSKDELLQPLHESCLNAFHPDESSKLLPKDELELVEKVWSVIRSYGQKGLLLSPKEDLLYSLTRALVGRSAFKNKMIQEVLSTEADSSVIYSKTEIPLILLDSLSTAEEFTFGKQLLTLYPSVVQNKQGLELTHRLTAHHLSQKDVSQSKWFLEKFYSFENPTNESFRLWLAFWLSLAEVEQKEESPRVKAWLDKIQLTSLKPDQVLNVFALAMKYQELSFLWSHWDTFKKVQESSLKQSFYNQSTALLKSDLLPEALADFKSLLKKFEEGQILLRLLESDPTLTSKDLKLVFAQSHPISEDLSQLDSISRLSAKIQKMHLKLNHFLPGNIKILIQTLQKEKERALGFQWSNASFKGRAVQKYKEDAEDAIQKIESVQKIAIKNRLPEVSNQLDELKTQIQGEISQLSQTEQGA